MSIVNLKIIFVKKHKQTHTHTHTHTPLPFSKERNKRNNILILNFSSYHCQGILILFKRPGKCANSCIGYIDVVRLHRNFSVTR